METELVGLQQVDRSEVQHTINVDAEALSIRNVADSMFKEGNWFVPMMVLFRAGERQAVATCRPWTNDKDRDAAFTEMGTLIPCFKADEVVLGFETILVQGDEYKRGHSAVSVLSANKIGLTIRSFPFYVAPGGTFERWTEDGTEAANYDPFASSLIGAYMAQKKRPFMSSATITTLSRRGHLVEVFVDVEEDLALRL